MSTIRSFILATLTLMLTAATAQAQSLSGLWFELTNPGHGVSVHPLPDDQYSMLWFAHCPSAQQCWYVADNFTLGESFALRQTYSVAFPASSFQQSAAVGAAVLTHDSDTNTLTLSVEINQFDCGVTASPVPPWCTQTPFEFIDEIVFERLTPALP